MANKSLKENPGKPPRRKPAKASSPRRMKEPRDPDPRSLLDLKNYMYAGILGVFTAAATFNSFGEMWVLPSPSEPSKIIPFVIPIILFAALVVMVFQWVSATNYELGLWVEWLHNPFQKYEVPLAMFSLSIALGLMLAFPHKIVVITAFITVYFFIDYWAQWLANDHFRRALEKTRKIGQIDETHPKILGVMEIYWLKRPQLKRIIIMTVVAFAALVFALLSTCYEPPRVSFQIAAYVLLILDLLAGEAVIAWWRFTRERDYAQIINAEDDQHGR